MYEEFNPFLKFELLCWDGEGAEGGNEGGGDEGGNEGGAGGGGEKTFTQNEVNEFVAERNKNLKAKYDTLEKSYNGLLSQQNLSKEQREKLQNELEAVRREMMTKEQRLEDDKRKAKIEYESGLQKANESAEMYKRLYETSTIDRAIQDAAIKHEGFNPKLFIAQLGPHSKMVDELDSEGKPTGSFVPRVEWKSRGEDGNLVTSLLTPDEAVAKMKEDVVEFGGLFKAHVAAGIGSGTAPGQASSAGSVDHSKISTAEYMRLASTEEGRQRLGLTR